MPLPDFIQKAIEAQGITTVESVAEQIELTLDDALHDPALKAEYVDPYGTLAEFNPDKAQEAADAGMSQALNAKRVQAWKEQASVWLFDLPAGTLVTADSMTAAVGLPDTPGQGSDRNNVVGALFSGWRKRGLIEFTGRYVKSERVERHGNAQREWRRTNSDGGTEGAWWNR
jgi:hypothetical protein